MLNENLDLTKIKIKKIFSQQMQDKITIKLMNISTADGFSIMQVENNSSEIEEDKVAAIASSLCALGSTSAKELINCSMDTVNVETGRGQVLFLSVDLLGTKCVLTQVSEKKMSLAEARFITKRVKSLIEAIS